MQIQEPDLSRGVMRFSAFQVDLRTGELRKHGIRIRLQDQPFRVLQILLEHPGEIISREELQRQIWPADTFVDFERGLNNAVKRLREALADSADEPRYIETIPKRGYRFIANLEGASQTGGNALGRPLTSPAKTDVLIEKNVAFSNRRARAAMFAAAVVLLGVSAVFVGNRLWGKVTSPRVQSVAVLPLQNLSGDPSQEYFADGMTEELITELSHLKDLKVISRTSVMRYKRTDKSLPEIARELNVDAVVEGSVLRAGERVRITVQLISARNDSNLWAETYDRTLQDSLAVQETVAKAIAGRINTSVAHSTVAQPTSPRAVNLKAHEAYLLGLHEDDQVNILSNHQGMRAIVEEHRRKAVEYYQQAIREDPNYAPAYLGLPEADDPADVEAKARKALELDDTLSEAHLWLGAVLLARDVNWQGAEKEFLRAIEVNPNYAPAHHGYAYYLDAVGRLDEGLKEYHRAQELDPAIDHLGAALYSRRDYARLIDMERRALATNPPGETDPNAVAHKVLMVAYARSGKHKESIEHMRSAIACMGFHDFDEEIRRAYTAGGYEAALRAYLRGAKKRPDWVFNWIDIYVYGELGEHDRAIARLARLNKDDPGSWQWVASSDGFGVLVAPTLSSLRVEPMWDPLHADPRFEELARQVVPEFAVHSKH